MFAQSAREVRRDEWEEPSGLRPTCHTATHETRTLAIITIYKMVISAYSLQFFAGNVAYV